MYVPTSFNENCLCKLYSEESTITPPKFVMIQFQELIDHACRTVNNSNYAKSIYHYKPQHTTHKVGHTQTTKSWAAEKYRDYSTKWVKPKPTHIDNRVCSYAQVLSLEKAGHGPLSANICCKLEGPSSIHNSLISFVSISVDIRSEGRQCEVGYKCHNLIHPLCTRLFQ